MTKLSIFLTVVLTSCGPKPSNLILPTKNQAVTVTQALSMCGQESSESFSAVKEMATRHEIGLSLIAGLSKSLRPKRSSISYLSRDDLEKRAQLVLHGPLAAQFTSTFEMAMKLKDELSALAHLNEQIERLEFLECNLDDYWQQSKIPYLAYVQSLSEGASLLRTTNLCSVFKGNSYCQIEARMAQKQERLEQMHENYLIRFEREFFKPRFKVISKLPGVSCSKSQDGTSVIQLPVKAIGFDLGLIMAASSRWSSSDKKVRLEIVPSNDSNAVQITRLESGPSHVNMNNRNVINLGPGHNNPLIIAHELGHTLGFPDCYFEGWDQAHRGFIYFELDPSGNNLMCNLKNSSTIQASYFDELKATYCN